MVFQHFNLFPHKTVLENIMMAPVTLKLKMPREAQAQALKLLERVGLADKKDEYPNMLSGGQKQRIAIVRALAMEPEVMLFDEPTSALDPISTSKIEDLAQELKDKYTIVIVTHNMQQALELGTRTLMMADGRIVLDVSGADRAGMTVEDLIHRFKAGTGKTLSNDRMLLS